MLRHHFLRQKKLHDQAVAESEEVDNRQSSTGREVELLQQLTQLEAERENLLQMRNSLQTSLSASADDNAPVQTAEEPQETDEAKLIRLQRERQTLLAARDELQRSAAAGMSMEDWRKKWDGTTLTTIPSAKSPVQKRPASLDVSEQEQRATGSVATGEEATLVECAAGLLSPGEEATLVERAAGLSLQEKQELADELRIMEQVQALTKQQKKQFASSLGPTAAPSSQISAEKFAEIEALCKAVVDSDISEEGKSKVTSILTSLKGDFPQLHGQEASTNLSASAPVHRSAPAAPAPIMPSPRPEPEPQSAVSTAQGPSENVSMLMNQLGSVQGLLSQLQNSSSEGTHLENLLSQLNSLPQPQARPSEAGVPTPPITPVRTMPTASLAMQASPFMPYRGMPIMSAPVTPRDLSQSATHPGHTPCSSIPVRAPASVARIDQLRRDQVSLEQLANQIDSSHAGLMAPFRSPRY